MDGRAAGTEDAASDARAGGRHAGPSHNPDHGNESHMSDSHDAHDLPFWKKYIFSTDHKVIGIQYSITGLLFLFVGFCFMMIIRWQLAYPGQPLPVIGSWFAET